MSEREIYRCKIQSVFVNFENRSMMVEGEANWLLFNLTPEGITYAIVDAPPEMVRGMRINLVSPEQKLATAAQELQQAEGEAKKTFTLTGRMKGAVKGGRPDSNGKPTSWGRFAAHRDGEDEAWMLSTTFHRAAAPIALGLRHDDQITAEGYIRPASDPTRMDSFSVFHLIDYPGKPKPTDR